MLPLHYLMKGNLYCTPGGAKALLEHICRSLRELLATYGAIWAHRECASLPPQQLGLGFTGTHPNSVRWSLPGVVHSSCKNLLWISKATEIPVSIPTVFVFFGSLSLTN